MVMRDCKSLCSIGIDAAGAERDLKSLHIRKGAGCDDMVSDMIAAYVRRRRHDDGSRLAKKAGDNKGKHLIGSDVAFRLIYIWR